MQHHSAYSASPVPPNSMEDPYLDDRVDAAASQAPVYGRAAVEYGAEETADAMQPVVEPGSIDPAQPDAWAAADQPDVIDDDDFRDDRASSYGDFVDAHDTPFTESAAPGANAPSKAGKAGFYAALGAFALVAAGLAGYKMGVFTPDAKAPAGLALQLERAAPGRSPVPLNTQTPAEFAPPPVAEAGSQEAAAAASVLAAVAAANANPGAGAAGAAPGDAAATAAKVNAKVKKFASPPATVAGADIAMADATATKAAPEAHGKPRSAPRRPVRATSVQAKGATAAAVVQARASRRPGSDKARKDDPIIEETAADQLLARAVPELLRTGGGVAAEAADASTTPARMTVRGVYPRGGGAARAWISLRDGRITTVAVGDTLPGSGVVQGIDAHTMTVQTSSGPIRP